MLRIDKSFLYRDSQLIKQFELEIKDFIELPDGSIVILLSSDYNSKDDQNVFRIDQYGSVIWKIKSGNYPDGPSIATSIRLDKENIVVFRMIGVDEYISLETGEIISSVFIK